VTSSDVDVVELVGEIDVGTADALERRLGESISDGRSVIVDLADCTFLDVRVLRVLRAGYEGGRRAGAGFVVVLPFSAAPEVRFLTLRLAAALAPYPVVPDRAAALVSLARSTREKVARLTTSLRVLDLRARVWENGRTRERLLAERDVLVFEQRATLETARGLRRAS
jgi:anti-anti-sigma factor